MMCETDSHFCEGLKKDKIASRAPMKMKTDQLMWAWKKFTNLSTDELYKIIQLRERVFVIEQNCIYLDCDDKDRDAWHLFGVVEGKIHAYLRAFGPGLKYAEAAFGRVVTSPELRGTGLGRELTAAGIERIRAQFSGASIRISAQAYLQKFYESFGFVRVSDEYREDDIPHIPHIEMLLK